MIKRKVKTENKKIHEIVYDKSWFKQQYKSLKNDPLYEFYGLLLLLGEDVSKSMIDKFFDKRFLADRIGVNFKVLDNIKQTNEEKINIEDLCKIMEYYGYKIDIRIIKEI